MSRQAISAWMVLGAGLLLFSLAQPSNNLHGDGKLARATPSEEVFATQVKPFLKKYCLACHGAKKKEAALDLAQEMKDPIQIAASRHLETVIQRLEANEMPPEDAIQPEKEERLAALQWLRDLRDREAYRSAGDPGPVLARRLSNAEFDYTIRDLTGVDIRPTREFPVDPANESGFDNSGESLTMSPALLKKYLAATRLVADHLLLTPAGLAFAPHPVVTETDRDKYCVHRIIDFYRKHEVNLAAYFKACWKYHHRDRPGPGQQDLAGIAAQDKLSPCYLEAVWKGLTQGDEKAGPLAALRQRWKELPAPTMATTEVPQKVLEGCQAMSKLLAKVRKPLIAPVNKVTVNGISAGSQPLVLWNNKQGARNHRRYAGSVSADVKKLAELCKGGDESLRTFFQVDNTSAAQEEMKKSLERFCDLFPDAFFISDRGPYFNPGEAGKGRFLTAGFHLMQGYFRDDTPLMELILDGQERQELDTLWKELNFITGVPMRQYADFIFFERAEPPSFMSGPEFDFARSEDKDANTDEKMKRLGDLYLAKAIKQGAKGEAVEAIRSYFVEMAAVIRQVEKQRAAAEPVQMQSLLQFAEKAYRRPLQPHEREGVLEYYRKIRKAEDLDHESAIRDTVAMVLLSPQFVYRFDLQSPEKGPQKGVPLSDYELASRLSYFLWSSMPDDELLSHARAGDLHQPEVLVGQTRRMIKDPRLRGLAVEFGANFLDFRRFEEHNSVDRQRFPSFTNSLRQAMFEEPVRYLLEIFQRNRSVLDLLYGQDTFVNRELARHYGMPEPSKNPEEWVHFAHAETYSRGGILPMAVFQTRNAPGLRTSPVKRGYWVVRRLLGEQIPPPPPTVPELPREEATPGELTLPQLLAKHRDNKACAGCHRRFDAIGVVFENYGPIGELRTRDLGNRLVSLEATFPDELDRKGLKGLQEYIRTKRQPEFTGNFARKLLAYALGRSLLLSDRLALEQIQKRWEADGYRFQTLVEGIVTTPQFLNKRGRQD